MIFGTTPRMNCGLYCKMKHACGSSGCGGTTRAPWSCCFNTSTLAYCLASSALDKGRICGFTFCVYEGHKAVIGDAYSMAAEPEQALYCTRLLLDHLRELLKQSPGVDRIESQMLLYDAGTLADSFRDAGFTLYMRLFMEYDIERTGNLAGDSMRVLPAHIEIRPWASTYYQTAAELIHSSYADHVDSLINDQYRSLHGSLRFLHNIVRFPGCGVFEPEQSWLLRDKRDGSLVGIILCSRIAHDVAHITQICVAKAFRGQGLGRALLQHCMAQLRSAGFAAVTLTVTESNEQAVKLYAELGFFCSAPVRCHGLRQHGRVTSIIRRGSWALRE